MKRSSPLTFFWKPPHITWSATFDEATADAEVAGPLGAVVAMTASEFRNQDILAHASCEEVAVDYRWRNGRKNNP
jgi:hypothetical protein